MEKILFKSQEQKTAQEAAAVLRQIAEKMESGRIALKRGGEEVILEIPGNVMLEIKAEEKERGISIKKQLKIEIEWTNNQAVGGNTPLSIG